MTANHDDDRDGKTTEHEPTSNKVTTAAKARAVSKPKRSFEQAIAEVEEIVSKLEGGRLGLSQSLDEYQRGVGTLKECYELLEVAERRVTLLSGFDADGNPVTEPFEEEAMTIQQKQAARSSRRSAPKSAGTGSGFSQSSDIDDRDSQDGLF